MAVVSAVSFTIFDWGRRGSQRSFMGAVAGTFLGKMTVVGVSVAIVLTRTSWPRWAFLTGLFGAWLLFSLPLLGALDFSARGSRGAPTEGAPDGGAGQETREG